MTGRIVTDVLDLVGALLVVAAAALAAWGAAPALGLLVAGCGLLGLSWVLDVPTRRNRGRGVRR